MRRTLFAVIAAFSLVPLACGGDDGGSGGGGGDGGNGDGGNGGALTCSATFGDTETPCGGDPSGSWTVTDTCSDFDFTTLVEEQCDTATQDSATYDSTGTLVVSADNFAYEVTSTISGVVSVPEECKVGTCDGTQSLLALLVDAASCLDDGAGCSCTLSNPFMSASAGSYSTADGVATIANTDNDEWYYCVSGDMMLLRAKSGDPDAPRPTFLLERE